RHLVQPERPQRDAVRVSLREEERASLLNLRDEADAEAKPQLGAGDIAQVPEVRHQRARDERDLVRAAVTEQPFVDVLQRLEPGRRRQLRAALVLPEKIAEARAAGMRGDLQ